MADHCKKDCITIRNYNPGTYLLIGNQCDNVASRILRAGGRGYFVSNTPNESFSGVCEEWHLPIQNI